MKIVVAADGSKYTKKALAYLCAQDLAVDGEVVLVNVQAPVPPRVRSMVGASAVANYHKEESTKVLSPIERFLAKHDLKVRSVSAIGSAGDEIVRIAKKEKAQLIVMGTHGHGVVGRALLGSVAQRVLHESTIPVLLVK